MDGMATMATETASLGGGCFWCLEAVYRDLRGVIAVKSGYMGGRLANPSYDAVCTGMTGHAEIVKIEFDPAQLEYADLLRVFFTIHDPTTLNRQGADTGTQYRSVIFTHSDEQAETAAAVMEEIRTAELYPNALVTKVLPAPEFYPAEPEHDQYFERNPYAGYCRAVVAPKVAKFRKVFADRVRSAAA
jgi:peptide-methionine (S)-S-oxide reductase